MLFLGNHKVLSRICVLQFLKLTLFVILLLLTESSCNVVEVGIRAHAEGTSRDIFPTILDANLQKLIDNVMNGI